MEKSFRIAALMTAPRYENTFSRNFIERALKDLGIPLTVSQGVFYGQCMQQMLEQLIEIGDVDYAVTVDFDTMFTANQLRRLISFVGMFPEIDAITGMQARRGKRVMLGTVPGGEMLDGDTKQVQWDGRPIKATTAHFGLTVISIPKLANVPRPWFYAKPNEAGGWNGEKVDDDVWFWMQWAKAGNSIYIDPGVRLGHLEDMVAIHDEQMNVKHVYPTDWEESAYALSASQTVERV